MPQFCLFFSFWQNNEGFVIILAAIPKCSLFPPPCLRPQIIILVSVLTSCHAGTHHVRLTCVVLQKKKCMPCMGFNITKKTLTFEQGRVDFLSPLYGASVDYVAQNPKEITELLPHHCCHKAVCCRTGIEPSVPHNSCPHSEAQGSYTPDRRTLLHLHMSWNIVAMVPTCSSRHPQPPAVKKKGTKTGSS